MAPERRILDGATVVTMDGGELLMVGGRTVVERDHVVTVDEHELTQSAVRAHSTLLASASTVTCKEGTAS